MPLLRTVVIHHSRSGLPVDDWVNHFDFVVDDPGSTGAQRDAIVGAIEAFYNTVQASGDSIDEYLSGRIDRPRGRTFKLYEKDDGEANFGSPIQIETGFDIAAAGASQNLPAEVALVASWHGDLTDVAEEAGGARPASQKRGRIFVGPFNALALGGGTTDPSQPATALRATIVDACQELRDFSDTLGAAAWSVVHAAQTAGWTATSVVGGFVNDAWDTQRPRGEAESTRTLW